MPNAVINESMRAGVLSNLADTFRQKQPKFEEAVKPLVKELPSENLREASYAFKFDLPRPKFWPYGKGRTYQTFKDAKIPVPLLNYELTVPWNDFDAKDDQMGDMMTHINSAVDNYGQLPVILFSEYFNGVAVDLPYLSLAYDGVSLFSAVDGDGNARFGVTGGNLMTSSGINAAGVIHDFCLAQQRFVSFLSPTARLPMFDATMASFSNMIAIIPPTLNEIFKKVSESSDIRIDSSNIVSESNFLKSSFRYVMNPSLTDTSNWYIVLNHEYLKPFVYRAPKKIESIIADASNSDHAREFNEYALYSHVRLGCAIYFPMTIIKIAI